MNGTISCLAFADITSLNMIIVYRRQSACKNRPIQVIAHK